MRCQSLEAEDTCERVFARRRPMKPDIVVGICNCKNASSLQKLLRCLGRSKLHNIGREICCLVVVEDMGLVGTLESEVAQPEFPLSIKTIVKGCASGATEIFDFAIAAKKDLILLGCDVTLFQDTLREMIAVAESDSMIGFVAPRSNEGGLCKLPLNATNDELLDPELAFTSFQAVSSRLPRMNYVPSVGTSCLLIKRKILQNFGGFDASLERHLQQIDLQLRANLCGYRTALANKAFIFRSSRKPTQTERLPESRDAAILRERYPYYESAITSYLGGSAYRATQVASCLAEDPLTIAFDFSSFGRRRDGTTEYGIRLFASFVMLFGQKYRIYAICEPLVWRHHGLDGIEGVSRSAPDSNELFSAVIRLSQPFDLPSAQIAASRGAISIVSMLDCIAIDCLKLSSLELECLWKFVTGFSDAIIYISEFSRGQFATRFSGQRENREFVSLPSTNVDEYAPFEGIQTPGDYLLIVGNSFAHKAVQESVEKIQDALPDQRVKVLGIKVPGLPLNHSYESGTLEPRAVHNLFSHSRAVIFPSHYEGFGFPLLHALGNKRCVFVRDLPVYTEIRNRVAFPQNIHAFESSEELVAALTPENLEWNDFRHEIGDVGWNRSAREIERILSEVLKSATMGKIESRLAQLELISEAFAGSQSRVRQLEEHIKAFETSTSWRLTAALRKFRRWFG